MDALATHSHSESDAREFFERLKPRRWKVLASTLICAALAATAAFIMTPYWESKIVMVPARNDKTGGLKSTLDSLGGLAAMAGVDLKAGDEQTQEALGVLKGRQFTEAFIVDKGLMPELFAKKWDPIAKRWKGPPEKWPTINKAYEMFDERIRTIDNNKKSGLITMGITWKNRDEAADWANEMVARLNAVMRARAIEQSSKNIGYLQGELANANYVEIRDAINHLIESQIRDKMVATATEEYAFRVVDRGYVSDQDEPARPKTLLMIAAGVVLGFIIGALPALFPSRPKPPGGDGSAGRA